MAPLVADGRTLSRHPVPPEQPTGFYLINALLAGDGQALLARLRHLALPAFTLGLLPSGIFEKVLRLKLRRALRSDYVEAATPCCPC